MTKEDALHLQIKSRFTDFLKAAELPYWEPALTVCPHCGEHAGILMDFMWSCQHCNKRGDVVDYVMAFEHLETKMAAIKRVCRALQIKVTTLEVISADELMDKQFENTGALIDGFIGRGVYLLAGSPKIGKSWLVLWLAHRVCLGEDVWVFKTKQCDVLYISLEDPEQRIQSRVVEITRGETGNLWFATETELMGKGFEEQITGFLIEHPSVKFIIVDTLQKVRQLRADQYSYAGDYEVISQMKSLADRFGITILLVHHTRKAEAADPFSMISGTTGLSGGVDGSLVMIKDERMDNRAKLYITGRDTLDMQLELLFDRTSSTWQFLGYGGQERIPKRDKLLGEVNDFLIDEGPFHGTASELLTLLSARTELQIKSANALTRLLNPQKSLLQYEYGILYNFERTGKERTLHLTRIPDDDSDDTLPPPVLIPSLPSPDKITAVCRCKFSADGGTTTSKTHRVMLSFKCETPCCRMKERSNMAKRRSNGEGTLRLRADGRWEMTIMDGFRDDGKRRFKTFYGKTQKEVKAKAKGYRDAKDSGLVVDVNYLFPEWANIWFENHRDNIAPTTQENYRYTLRILNEGFARRRIADVKPYDIETFLKKLRRDGRSDSCLAQCRGMLYQIFNKAEANDLIRKNPVRFAEKMRKTGPVQRKECFTAEEVTALMELLPDNRIGWSIRRLLGTGMRSQELLALEPRHIEPDGSCIHIRQAINMIKGTAVVGTPKSRDSYRDVPVPESIREYAIKLRTTEAKFIWEIKKKDAPCNPATFRDHFKKALEEIPGVRVLTPHSCRHTYVSQMQALGVDLATIQSIVGHADVDMTQHYLHVQESIRQDAIARFSKAFTSETTDPDKPTDRACKVVQFPRVG